MRRRRTISSLGGHPNTAEVTAVLARVPAIDDAALRALALAWQDGPGVAEARAAALTPDTPLVVEALRALDAVSALYADDLCGQADYVTVDPATTARGLHAVRDALVGAYARPALTRAQHRALLTPWRAVFGESGPTRPDLGPQTRRVEELLAHLALLAVRCHDPHGRRIFDGLAACALVADDGREDARRAAWDAAVLTSRRRVWALVQRRTEEALRSPCPTCRPAARPGRGHGEEGRDEQRVVGLCADAVCAVLMADALADATVAACTAPLADLVPRQRASS